MVPRLPRTHVPSNLSLKYGRDVKIAAMMLMLLLLAGCANTLDDAKALHPDPAPDVRITYPPVMAPRSATPVLVTPEVLLGFSFLYRYIDETEFVLCLEGQERRGRVHVTGFRLALIKRSTIGSASYAPCTNRDYVGTAHNHPPVASSAELCAQSQLDRETFHQDGRALVDIILCGDSRYVWVLKDGRSEVDEGIERVRRELAKAMQ